MMECNSLDFSFHMLLEIGFTPQKARDQLLAVVHPDTIKVLKAFARNDEGMNLLIDSLNRWRASGVEPPWDDDLIATVAAAADARAASKNDLLSP